MIVFIYAAIILCGIGIDQLTKYLAVTNLPIDSSPDVKVWEGVFHIRCISNDGAAFGMLDDHRWIFMTVSTVVIAVVLGMLIFRYKQIPFSLGIALSLVVCGGIGNMIDRVVLGYVVDFIYFVPIDFPCFNVADSLVCIGAVLMFLCVLFTKDPADTAKTEPEPALAGDSDRSTDDEAVNAGETSAQDDTAVQSADASETQADAECGNGTESGNE